MYRNSVFSVELQAHSSFSIITVGSVTHVPLACKLWLSGEGSPTLPD